MRVGDVAPYRDSGITLVRPVCGPGDVPQPGDRIVVVLVLLQLGRMGHQARCGYSVPANCRITDRQEEIYSVSLMLFGLPWSISVPRVYHHPAFPVRRICGHGEIIHPLQHPRHPSRTESRKAPPKFLGHAKERKRRFDMEHPGFQFSRGKTFPTGPSPNGLRRTFPPALRHAVGVVDSPGRTCRSATLPYARLTRIASRNSLFPCPGTPVHLPSIALGDSVIPVQAQEAVDAPGADHGRRGLALPATGQGLK